MRRNSINVATGTVQLGKGLAIALLVHFAAPAAAFAKSGITVNQQPNDWSLNRIIERPTLVDPLTNTGPRLSHDKQKIAFVVHRSSIDCNCQTDDLYILDTKSRGVRLLQGSLADVHSVQWASDDRHVSYLSAESGSTQLWWVDTTTGVASQLLSVQPNMQHSFARQVYEQPPDAVLDYVWSSNGRYIAYTVSPAAPAKVESNIVDNGLVYDDAEFSDADVYYGDWTKAHRHTELWLLDVATGSRKKIWDSNTSAIAGATLQKLSWSPDQTRLSFSLVGNRLTGEKGLPCALVVINVRSAKALSATCGSTSSLTGRIGAVTWSGDSRAIAVLTSLDMVHSDLKTFSPDLTLLSDRNLPLPLGSQLIAWPRKGLAMYFLASGIGQDQEETGTYSYSAGESGPRRLSSAKLKVSNCSSRFPIAACIVQSPTKSPRLAMVNLATGSIRPLRCFRQCEDTSAIMTVKQLHLRNRFGALTTSYLLLPRRANRRRLPLVVMSYGFTGEFVTQASSALTSYPALPLVESGMAVLLFDPPRYREWAGDDFGRGSIAIGESPLSSLSQTIRLLSKAGIIDPARVGFAGHSYGGWLVEYAISHSRLFAAAEMHNGGTSADIGSYWATDWMSTRKYEDHLLGGPPYGSAFPNYRRISPSFNADRIHTPILLEEESFEATDDELFAALRTFDRPVEKIIYPDAGHMFFKPRQRLSSMQRNLDWFRFWLQGQEEPTPAKQGRYARWEELCKVQVEQNPKQPMFCSSGRTR